MTAIRRINFCRDLENNRDRIIVWFNGFTNCFQIEPDDKAGTEAKRHLVITDEDGITPICRIDIFRNLEPDEGE